MFEAGGFALVGKK